MSRLRLARSVAVASCSEKLVWDAAEGLPFDRLFVMINQQEFTKTANCWGVENNSKGTNTNRVVVLRRVQ